MGQERGAAKGPKRTKAKTLQTLPGGAMAPPGGEKREGSKSLGTLSQNAQQNIPHPQDSPDYGPDIFPSD